MEQNNYNVLDILLSEKNKYIILFSGLDMSPINHVVKELCNAFNATILDFNHLEFDDSLDPINNRVKDLLKKDKQILFIKGKSFITTKLKIPVDQHINISINERTVNNTELFSKYKAILGDNRINKYFNFKHDQNVDEYIDKIFLHIIDDIEKKVYKDKYETLSYKFYVEGSNESNDSPKEGPSKLTFDAKSITQEEKNIKLLEEVDDELNENLDDTDETDSDDSLIEDNIRVR